MIKQDSGSTGRTYTVICGGAFPTLNEYIRAMNRSKYAGNDFKKQYQKCCELYIRRDLHGVHLGHCGKPVFLKYKFFEQNKKRDLDNVAGFFHKIFQDALTECAVINNDGWAYITGFEDRFYVDAKNPRVEIEITLDEEKTHNS